MNIPSLFHEKEGDMPENWVSDTILIRDGKGNIISLQIEDDKEE